MKLWKDCAPTDRVICDQLSTLQLLQMNNWLALGRLTFTPLHHLWIHFLQLQHKIELLSTPFLHSLTFTSTLSFLYSSSNLCIPT